MSKSKIEWTEQTWNPIVGCSIVSPGCTNCYAMKMASRIEAMGNQPRYAGTTRKVKGNAIWTGKLAQAPDSALLAPLRRKKPTVYFVNSMGDLFHEDCPEEWIDEAACGRWDRKARAHIFDGDAVDTIDPILLTGEYTLTKQDFGQFDTPMDLAFQVAGLARIEAGMSVLEPSAGIGNLVDASEKVGGRVEAFEIDAKRLHACKDRCILAGGIRLSDFLSSQPEPIFDRVLMNPPFAKQADIRHVTHAAKFLKPGGRLVSIMSASVTFRTDARTEEFRNFINSRGATHEALPQKAFKDSGTAVNAVVVTFGASSAKGD